MSHSNTDIWERERLAQLSVMESLAKFTEKVVEGEATPEQIAYMTEVAKAFDKEKYERIKSELHRRLGTSFEMLSLI